MQINKKQFEQIKCTSLCSNLKECYSDRPNLDIHDHNEIVVSGV